MQIWISWRKRNLFDLEWLAEEKRKGEDLERERLRNVEEIKKKSSFFQARMQGARLDIRPQQHYCVLLT